jgi:hypothetical protein
MDATELTYPFFEANQVLSNAHLNDLFEYLDEQTRLTRANLIGIGVACGLEVRFEAPGTVHLSRGCGVTSQGYLIVEPEDLTLAHVRTYTLPTEYGYPPFVDPGTNPAKQFDLWELFADDDEPGAQPLATSGLLLEDKAVVLFLDLSKDRLRNCSPNNCDDRGAEVTATVRVLLVDVTDLDKVIAAAAKLAPISLGADLTERLRLPDIRMPRVDVPNTGPVTPQAVLRAFQDTFRQDKLVARTDAALKALYAAFRPLVGDLFGSDPFTGLTNRFGFLDAVPATTAQVRFLPYYWDLFDDLLAAYDEVRWAGVDLLCACCPPEGLFPRHLMVGVLAPANYDTADYRHRFVRSPAVGDCVDRTHAVRTLFGRLVAIVDSFTEKPPDKGIKATPSRWGDAPLSAKAIPYYYGQAGTPPMFELWDPVKTSRGRANQNLGYRADAFVPAPPAFVTEPLRFDLEPHNFLRIEGHLGKNVQTVLEALLALKESHRLPIEVVALRTGTFDENVEVDLAEETCRFRDLETLYDTLKAELICFLVKQVQYFYDLPLPEAGGAKPVTPTLSLLRRYAPDVVAAPATMGFRIEAILTWRPGQPPPISAFVVTLVFELVGAMSNLAARLPDDLRQVDFGAVGDRYHRLVEIARQVEEVRRSAAFDEPGLSDRLDDIVFRCRLEPFEAIAEEYKRRVREAKQAGFLAHFLEHHPGVQHKAGVPLGGTFILVYHELPRVVTARDATPVEDASKAALLGTALARLQYKEKLAEDPDLQLLYRLFTGKVLVPRPPLSGFLERIYFAAVAGLPDGAVIADFFLPYVCCSDCPPIEYQLPSARLRVSVSTGCTGADGVAEVVLQTEGTSGSLSVQVDGGPFAELSGPLLLGEGDHTVVVRDAAGTESSPVEITIPPQLVFKGSQVTVKQAAGTYEVVAVLQGGTPPFVANAGSVTDRTYTSPPVPLDDRLRVVVTDAAGCTVEATFTSGVNPCDLPCEGAATREGFRFWIPEARQKFPLNKFRADVRTFTIIDPDGQQRDLTAEVAALLQPPAPPTITIRSSDFPAKVQGWVDGINAIVAAEVGSDEWFRMEYEAAPEPATTGVLFVDRLACVDFVFVLVVGFTQARVERQFELRYDASGTVIIDPPQQLRIPPFRGSTSNKCRPDEPPVPRCQGTDLKLAIKHGGAFPNAVVLAADVSGNDTPVAFLWEVQDGVPPVAGGAKVKVDFHSAVPPRKRVRLTAYTDKGCTVTQEQTIDITSPDG